MTADEPQFISDEVIHAVRSAACGNIEVWHDCGNTSTILDAFEFVRDLRASGYDIVKVPDA